MTGANNAPRGIAGLIVGTVFLLSCSGPGLEPGRPPLSISWVSADRLDFEPEKSERVTLRFRVSAPADVTVRFLDPRGEPARSIHQVVEQPGERSVVWDGRDNDGHRVPPDAYVYTIAALPTDASEKEAQPTIYDLQDRTGGELVRAKQVKWDRESGRLTYQLPKPSRVRVILGQPSTGWLCKTLLDWEPRSAGRHEERSDDHTGMQFCDTPELESVVQAFALPNNVVIVKGMPAEPTEAKQRRSPDKVPHRTAPTEVSQRALLQHALHPWSRCYEPQIEISLPGAERVDDLVRLTGPTPLRVDIASRQPVDRTTPIPRMSVFLYIDGVLVERNLDGYVPYQWILDPQEVGSGEHVVTGVLAWSEDHYGVKHVRIQVGK